MRREALKLLWDMREAGNAVFTFLQGKSLEDYRADLMLRSAVERQLFIVGEALAQLSRWDEEAASRFSDRQAIIGFRNRLAHGYSEVVDERVYEIAVDFLPVLVLQVASFLND